jgi:hypothetical protein
MKLWKNWSYQLDDLCSRPQTVKHRYLYSRERPRSHFDTLKWQHPFSPRISRAATELRLRQAGDVDQAWLDKFNCDRHIMLIFQWVCKAFKKLTNSRAFCQSSSPSILSQIMIATTDGRVPHHPVRRPCSLLFRPLRSTNSPQPAPHKQTQSLCAAKRLRSGPVDDSSRTMAEGTELQPPSELVRTAPHGAVGR